MYLLVSGSRNIKDKEFVFACLNNISKEYKIECIIHGDAKGVDTITKKYAYKNYINQRIFAPKYNIYGKKAPIIRNSDMVSFCDKGVCIWDGKSRGTKDTIDKLKKQNKLLKIFYYNY